MAFWMASLACHLRYALIILCVILIVILFSKWTGGAASASANANAPVAVVVKTTSSSCAAAAAAVDVPPATATTIHALVRQARALFEKTSEQLHAAAHHDSALLLQLGMQASYALCYVECAQQMLLATTGDDGAVLDPLVHSLEGLRDEILTLAGASSSSSSSRGAGVEFF